MASQFFHSLRRHLPSSNGTSGPKLHLGCGPEDFFPRLIKGWINLDTRYDHPDYGAVDVTAEWPFADNSVAAVYSEDLFEHLVGLAPGFFETGRVGELGSRFSSDAGRIQDVLRFGIPELMRQGLYLVGAGTHPGAGIPGVVGSAKATAFSILEQA